VRARSWRSAHAEAGFAEDAAYLLRPDGHVALALPHQDPTTLSAWADRWFS